MTGGGATKTGTGSGSPIETWTPPAWAGSGRARVAIPKKLTMPNVRRSMRIRCISMSSSAFPGHFIPFLSFNTPPLVRRGCMRDHTGRVRLRTPTSPSQGCRAFVILLPQRHERVRRGCGCSLASCDPGSPLLYLQVLYHLPGGCRGGYHVLTPMRERLVGEAVGADAGLGACAAGRYAPSLRRRISLVADDTHASREVWRAGGKVFYEPRGAGEPSPGCLFLFDDTAA